MHGKAFKAVSIFTHFYPLEPEYTLNRKLVNRFFDVFSRILSLR